MLIFALSHLLQRMNFNAAKFNKTIPFQVSRHDRESCTPISTEDESIAALVTSSAFPQLPRINWQAHCGGGQICQP
jgi:hypothetical protein